VGGAILPNARGLHPPPSGPAPLLVTLSSRPPLRAAMTCYVIAGKADDPAFARAEYAAKQVEAACPNVFFQYEMKLPDLWKEFILSVFRKYDFDSFSEDFSGPLIWTHEGTLIGETKDFVQKICIEKFGIKDPPPVSDPVFKAIAADNLKQVKQQQHLKEHGPSFAERVEAASNAAKSSGLVVDCVFDDRRHLVIEGASHEVCTSSSLTGEWAKLRESYGQGQSASLDVGLKVGTAGKEQSHLVVLHPEPLARKHLVLVPNREVKESEILSEEEAALDAQQKALPLLLPPHGFRDQVEEDLSLMDFIAAMDVLLNVSGVATWMGLRGASEYRHPVDTHLQVLPFPIHSFGEGSPLRYPLELCVERAAQENATSLKAFPFQHYFTSISDPNRESPSLGKAAVTAYEQARSRFGKDCSCMVAFTTTWLIMLPLQPPSVESARHEAWLRMPPPPPCALCGVVVCPTVPKDFPETAGLLTSKNGSSLVSTRAAEEGIPEGSPEYRAASYEVRIARRILDAPAEIVGVWALHAMSN